MRCFTKVLTVSWCVFLACLLGAPTANAADEGRVASHDSTAISTASAAERYGNLPLSFEANQGQTDSQVRFLSRGSGYSFFLTQTGAVLSFASDAHAVPTVLQMELSGASASVRVQGLDELPGRSNYFLGSNSSGWHTDVPTFSKVAYDNVYPGISLVYYGNQHQLEYDFVVTRGADPRQIRLTITGAQKLQVDARGNLVLHSTAGEVQLLAPKVYQESKGQKQEIAGQWSLEADNVAGFKVGAYDRTQPLVIDPVMQYSSFLGGSQKNSLNKIAVDAAGNAYVAGYTTSGNFPAAPTPQSMTFGSGTQSRGAFVAKIDSTGSNLLFSTYLSGSADEEATGLAVDSSGNIYVAGNTHSVDFPTRDAFQSTCATHTQARTCSSAFLTKISSTGDSLLFSTYLGGSGGESARSLAVDSEGSAYLVGVTSSVDFPVTAGAAQTRCGGACQQNAFIAKFNPTGEALTYASYLGGSGSDDAADLAVDATGNIYVTGHTTSPDFPLASPYQKSCTIDATASSRACVATAFVTKIKSDGSAFAYSTYLGGNLGSQASAIAVDSKGDAYATGSTQSADFPVAKPFQKSCGLDPVSHACSGDAFLTKLAPTGKTLVYSTYFGGAGTDEATGIAIDAGGDVHIVGRTESSDLPTASSMQSKLKGASDAFVARFNPTGSALTFSTYHGGSATESGNSIALDAKGNVYITGETSSPDFPTQHPFQSSCAGACANAFVTKMALPPVGTTASTTTLTATPNPSTVGQSVTFTATVTGSSGTPTGNVDFLDGATNIGNVTLDGTGAATLMTSTLTAGSHSVTADYNGDATYDVSTSNTVTQNVIAPPSIAKAFVPTTIVVNGTSTLTLTITNPAANTVALTGVAFTDTFPAGVKVDTPNGLSNTCGGTATATAGSGSASLTGGTVATGSTCTVVVKVTSTTAGTKVNTTNAVSSTNGGTGNTATDTLTVNPAPVLAVVKGHTGTFSQGGTGTWTVDVSNTATGSTTTSGLSVTDTFASGFTLASSSGTNWSCSGTTTATCTSTSTIAGGSAYPTLTLNVNVPNSATTVSNTATASGGGATASASGSDNGVAVTQVPANLTATSGGNQSVPVGNDFAAFSATVTDAGATPIQGVAVTFTVQPAGGASCSFGGNASTTANSNASGVATTTVACTANNTAGTYSVQASVATSGVPKPTFATKNTDFSLAFTPTFSDVAPGSVPAGVTLKATAVNGYAPTSLTVTNCVVTSGPTPVPTCSIGSPITVGTAAAVTFSTTGSPAGIYTVQSTVHDSSTVNVTHTATFALHLVQVTISTTPPATLEVNQTLPVAASTAGLVDTTVNWDIVGTSCSGAACGSFSSAGPNTSSNYLSPATTSAGVKAAIRATSNGDANFNAVASAISITSYNVSLPAPTLVIPQTNPATNGTSTLTASAVNGYAGTINTSSCSVLPATALGPAPTCSVPAPAVPGSSVVSVTTQSTTPTGLYSITAQTTDNAGNPQTRVSAAQPLAVDCKFNLGSSSSVLPVFNPATTATPANSFTFGVAETAGGGNCAWGDKPVVGVTINGASPDGTVVTSLDTTGDVLTAVNGFSQLTIGTTTPVSAGVSGSVTVPYFDPAPAGHSSNLTLTVGLEAPQPITIIKGGTVSGFPLPSSQFASSTLSIPNANLSGVTTVCGAVDGNGNPDPANANFGITCTATASSGSIQLSVTLPASSASLHRSAPSVLYAVALGFPAIVFLSVGVSAFAPKPRKQGLKRITGFLGIILLLSLVVVLPACGGGFHANFITGGTANYTLTVMGYATDSSGNVSGIDVFTVPLTIN